MGKEYLVCVDSDGCVFDSMTAKHRQCFTRVFVDFFYLHPISDLAGEVWEYINLKSSTRGCNRFKALLRALDMLRDHPAMARLSVEVPKLEGLAKWLARAEVFSNDSLEDEYRRTGDPDLGIALEWSRAGSELVGRLVGRSIPPFPGVLPALAAIAERADIVAITQGPTAMIADEWEAHGLSHWAKAIRGQEYGTKSRIIAQAIKGVYGRGKTLVVGDSPCDFEAAKDNGCRFYPIPPGREDEAWGRIIEEGFRPFLGGSYSGGAESVLLADFFRGFEIQGPPSWCSEGSPV